MQSVRNCELLQLQYDSVDCIASARRLNVEAPGVDCQARFSKNA